VWYLGLDPGTSGVKALLMDADQSVLAAAVAPLGVQRPQPGWSEQRPADWVAIGWRPPVP
jgi:xylulokinase